MQGGVFYLAVGVSCLGLWIVSALWEDETRSPIWRLWKWAGQEHKDWLFWFCFWLLFTLGMGLGAIGILQLMPLAKS
jgi:hypothetical protein